MTIVAEPAQTTQEARVSLRDVHQSAAAVLIDLLAFAPEDAEVRHWSISYQGHIRGFCGAAADDASRFSSLRLWADLLDCPQWSSKRYEDDPDWGQVAVSGLWRGQPVEISTGTMRLAGLDVPELVAVDAQEATR